ncbi:MAG TPA: hypothetical protein IAB00_01525 [Candidatus Avidehalobacter gallistercoris]|uniref:Uncharacterized protein n=1 Tax=Candidatus Avidehalobacter gallistercoris TaxID=2840694 RepID=A0A9D1KY49_9FIRM|nr:hypothetical protein [Candidatus Avidehalobacter gallistercoris]
MNKFNIDRKVILAIIMVFLIILATAFSTIKIMNYRESVLLDNEIKRTIGTQNFEELGHIETKTVTNVKYYAKDGSLIIEENETSDKTTNYNQ